MKFRLLALKISVLCELKKIRKGAGKQQDKDKDKDKAQGQKPDPSRSSGFP